MESTPKLQRKSSLSLSSRLNKKRHSASPQNLVKSISTNTFVNGRELNANCDIAPRSPSMYSVCSDGGIECTPPHKKSTRSVEDTTDSDYSPQVFDSSFSPSCFLSQTMCVDSPEVGWKWKRHNEDNSSRTPDSAYAADSSFTSAGSSSTEVMRNARARSDNYKKRRASDARKDMEFRRVQKTAADEKLKQRCAKLQEQLKSAGALNFATEKTVTKNSRSSRLVDMDVTTSDKISYFKINSPLRVSDKVEEKTRAAACENNLDDFFNDSDDGFLLAATQEIELKIKTSPTVNAQVDPKSMPIAISDKKKTNYVSTSSSNTITTTSAKALCASATCTTASLPKEKRSSFYMKFLEDDCTDDWFISLDEAVLQATQSKKPRTSLQRYKSMPTNSNDAKVKPESTVNKSDPLLNEPANSFAVVAGPSSETQSPKIKRHSSSHALSSASTNYRDRQNRSRK